MNFKKIMMAMLLATLSLNVCVFGAANTSEDEAVEAFFKTQITPTPVEKKRLTINTKDQATVTSPQANSQIGSPVKEDDLIPLQSPEPSPKANTERRRPSGGMITFHIPKYKWASATIKAVTAVTGALFFTGGLYQSYKGYTNSNLSPAWPIATVLGATLLASTSWIGNKLSSLWGE